MTDDDTHVKGFSRRLGTWIDCHPRTGWWIAVLAVVNTVLNLLDLLVR